MWPYDERLTGDNIKRCPKCQSIMQQMVSTNQTNEEPGIWSCPNIYCST